MNDRECAMSSSGSSTQNQIRAARMATRQHLTSQANQARVCFVLNEYSDDPDTSAFVVGQNVLLPTEATDRAMDDNENVQERNVSRYAA